MPWATIFGFTEINRNSFPMAHIFNNIVETVGRTPLVRLNKVTAGANATILLKCEFFNPLGSVKDRIGMAMIEDAERPGVIKKGNHDIEPTSGNTGIALAFVAAAKGYKLILTMPDTMSVERRTLLAMLGAKPRPDPRRRGNERRHRARRTTSPRNTHSWIPQQFENPANPEIHRRTTAEEIWNDTDGQVDIRYFGSGHRRDNHGLRRNDQTAQSLFPSHRRAEPKDSPVISQTRRPAAQTRPAQNSGRRRGIHPKNLHLKDSKGNPQIVECVQVTNDEAFAMARRLGQGGRFARRNFHWRKRCRRPARAARPENKGKMIVTLPAPRASVT